MTMRGQGCFMHILLNFPECSRCLWLSLQHLYTFMSCQCIYVQVLISSGKPHSWRSVQWHCDSPGSRWAVDMCSKLCCCNDSVVQGNEFTHVHVLYIACTNSTEVISPLVGNADLDWLLTFTLTQMYYRRSSSTATVMVSTTMVTMTDKPTTATTPRPTSDPTSTPPSVSQQPNRRKPSYVQYVKCTVSAHSMRAQVQPKLVL